jgi:hypothetical protein
VQPGRTNLFGTVATGHVPPGARPLSNVGEVQARMTELQRQFPGFQKPIEVLEELRTLQTTLSQLSRPHPTRLLPTLGVEGPFVGNLEARSLSPKATTLVNQLVATTQQALKTQGFDARNALNAEGVATQAAAFTTAAISGDSKVEAALFEVFRATAAKAGQSLALGFSLDGKPNPAMRAPFEGALAGSRQVVADAMPRMLAALDEVRGRPVKAPRDYQLAMQQVLKRTRLEDMAELLKGEMKLSSTKTGPKLREDMGIIVPEEDSRQGEIDRIPLRRSSEVPLAPAEREMLALKNRLEHAVQLAQQVHRAAYGDGVRPDPKLIDPNAYSGAFNAYDAQKVKIYSAAQAIDSSKAFARTLFEVYKDTWPK